MFGIDQQVQQTADAYRGKPEMLQQKYAQNQQLIDLLALQKLKSDKEEASRQIALQMGNQGKPQTIADQRESQVLDMTKKEVIDEQAGVMQNKMKQMQMAQQKLMQSAGAPQMPAQAAPQPQQPPAAGLAGLAAPNIQGMAGGGIVAFDQGGQAGAACLTQQQSCLGVDVDKHNLHHRRLWLVARHHFVDAIEQEFEPSGQVGALCRLGADGAAGHIAQLAAFGIDDAKARGLQARINAQDAHGVSF